MSGSTKPIPANKHGQALLLPNVEMEDWWTSLDKAKAQVIECYCDHGTGVQFHSEFKIDLDLARLQFIHR